MDLYDIFEENVDNLAEKIPFGGKFPLELLEGYDWNRHMHALDSHPRNRLDLNSTKFRIGLNVFHQRESCPAFAKDIERILSEVFSLHNNRISNIAFTGFGPDSDSYPRHKDEMDVFLVQIIGDIKIQVEGLHEEPVPFLPGDYYWIPRGVYHQVFPITSRVSFSFGVEGDPDPSVYF